MKVVITGGMGFLGQRLARALLNRETLTGASGEQERIDEMILFDAVVPDQPPAGLEDERVSLAAGDVADGETVRALIAGESLSVFHFASVVSAGAEQDFDLALAVNLTGGLNVLEACRAAPGLPGSSSPAASRSTAAAPCRRPSPTRPRSPRKARMA